MEVGGGHGWEVGGDSGSSGSCSNRLDSFRRGRERQFKRLRGRREGRAASGRSRTGWPRWRVRGRATGGCREDGGSWSPRRRRGPDDGVPRG